MTQRRYEIEEVPDRSYWNWKWIVYEGTGEQRAEGRAHSQDEAVIQAKAWIEKNPGKEADPDRERVFRELITLGNELTDPLIKNSVEWFIRNADDISAHELVYLVGSTLDNTSDVPIALARIDLALDYSRNSFVLRTLVSSEGTDDPNNRSTIIKRYRYRDMSKEFFSKYFLEIQSIVCKNYSTTHLSSSARKKPSSDRASGEHSTGMAQTASASGLAAWIASSFSLHNSMAIALATSVIMLVVTAGRAAFCKMDFEGFWRSVEAGASTPEGEKPDQKS
jgi:hypothetical protein